MLIDDLNAVDRELLSTVEKLVEQIEDHTRRDAKAAARFISQTDGALRAALEVVSANLHATRTAVELVTRYARPGGRPTGHGTH